MAVGQQLVACSVGGGRVTASDGERRRQIVHKISPSTITTGVSDMAIFPMWSPKRVNICRILSSVEGHLMRTPPSVVPIGTTAGRPSEGSHCTGEAAGPRCRGLDDDRQRYRCVPHPGVKSTLQTLRFSAAQVFVGEFALSGAIPRGPHVCCGAIFQEKRVCV